MTLRTDNKFFWFYALEQPYIIIQTLEITYQENHQRRNDQHPKLVNLTVVGSSFLFHPRKTGILSVK